MSFQARNLTGGFLVHCHDMESGVQQPMLKQCRCHLVRILAGISQL
jgi:hypothetical protein